MRYANICIAILFLSLLKVNAQEYKYFKVEKASYGTVLRPLSNEDLYRDVNQSPVYLGNNFNECIIQVMNVMTTVITEDVWNKFSGMRSVIKLNQ